MKITLLVFALFFQVNILCVQTIFGNLEVYLNHYLDSIPQESGNDFQIPNSIDLDTWESLIELVLDEDTLLAKNIASSINYTVLSFIDTSKFTDELYYVIEEKTPKQNYWGTYVFKPSACRMILNLQAPHTKHDKNTGKQAIFCFTRISAKSLFLAGTHRCNNDSSSTCSGTTSVCANTPSAYKVSDLAHNVNSCFQKTTEVIYNNIDSAIFIQFHGFNKLSTDPYVIMSNGTRKTPEKDYIPALKNALFAIDDSLSFKIAHIDTSWNRLIGFSNTQGRYLNESADACLSNAQETKGKFIHIEQERIRLRKDSLAWNKMKNSLEQVFVCSDLYTDLKDIQEHKLTIYPNPITSNFLFVEGNQINKISISDYSGKLIFSEKINNDFKTKINLSTLIKGIYFIEIKNNQEIYRTKIIKF